jgi:flagellar hook-length control protein FliK
MQILESSGHFSPDAPGVVNKGQREEGGSSFSSILSSSKGDPVATESGQLSHASGKKLPEQQETVDDHHYAGGGLPASRIQTDASGKSDAIEEPLLTNDLLLPEQMAVQTAPQQALAADEKAVGAAGFASATAVTEHPVNADKMIFARVAEHQQQGNIPVSSERVEQDIVHDSAAVTGVATSLLTAADTGRIAPEVEPVANAVREAVQSLIANQASSQDLKKFLQQNGNHQAANNILPASGSSEANAAPFLQALSDSAVTMPSARVQVPVGQQGWGEAVGQQVTWFISRNISAASLRLHPQHLGPMEMAVRMDGDQASVTFTSQHAIVREALESSIPRLREMLSENGLDLVNVNVSQQGKSHGDGQNASASRQEDGVANADSGANEPVSGPDVRRITVHTQGLVDYYA